MRLRFVTPVALLAGAVLAVGTAAYAKGSGSDSPLAPLDAPASPSETDAGTKSPFAALAWELIPGAGSLYADDVPGALTTWALIVGGTAASVWGFSMLSFPDSDSPAPRHSSAASMPLVLGGLGLAVFGRIHGFVSAYAATERYNAALAQRAVLSPSSLSFAPTLTSNGSPGFVLGGRF